MEYKSKLDFYKKFSMIVAASDNGAIGKNNDLLWHLPKDLKRFKEITDNKIIIMGKNTYLSLPNGALPNRINIVLSRDEEFLNKTEEITTKNTGIIKLKEIDDVFNFIYNFEKSKKDNHDVSTQFNTDEFIVIGGGIIYKLFLEYINKIYLTKVHVDIEGDTFIPDLSPYNWKLLSIDENIKDDKHKYDYTFLEMEKIDDENDEAENT